MTRIEDQMAAEGSFSGRSAEEYRRALRHSRLVSWLRVILPVASFAVIAAFVAVSWLSRTLPDNMSVDRTSIANGTIVMDNPVLTGQTEDARTFTVRARRASQAIGRPDVITLADISAELPASAEETASVRAESGIYDRRDETLTLDAPFHAQSTGGLEVAMESARFDLDARSMVSKAPVSLRIGETALVAQSVRMHDNGETILFDGGVRMTISPSTIRGDQKDGN